ncbi:hypothetical protein EAF00_003005 [Botryotinia globosa]|nr:hypothetical protein EAF00_003005 [Botryotinia globosa]
MKGGDVSVDADADADADPDANADASKNGVRKPGIYEKWIQWRHNDNHHMNTESPIMPFFTLSRVLRD